MFYFIFFHFHFYYLLLLSREWGRGKGVVVCPLLTLISDSLRTFEGHALYRQISKLFACLRFAAVYYVNASVYIDF